MNELQTLERELADEAARSDIESFCPWTSPDPDERWYDTSADIEIPDTADEAIVRRAVRYLELRGLIERHSERPELVRFREALNSGDGSYRS